MLFKRSNSHIISKLTQMKKIRQAEKKASKKDHDDQDDKDDSMSEDEDMTNNSTMPIEGIIWIFLIKKKKPPLRN